MHAAAIVIIAAVVFGAFWAFPRGARYMLMVPILGFVFGSFCWALTALFVPAALSLHTYGAFVGGAAFIAFLLALTTDRPG